MSRSLVKPNGKNYTAVLICAQNVFILKAELFKFLQLFLMRVFVLIIDAAAYYYKRISHGLRSRDRLYELLSRTGAASVMTGFYDADRISVVKNGKLSLAFARFGREFRLA